MKVRKNFLISFTVVLLFFIGATSLLFTWKQKEQLRGEKIIKTTEVYPVRMYFFYSNTCPHCRDENKFLPKLEKEIPFLVIERFEISNSSDEITRYVFSKLTKKHSTEGAIPLTIIGENVTLGFNDDENLGADFKNQIKECALNGCDSWLDNEYDIDNTLTQRKIDISSKQFEFIFKK